jgi:hypothetical protein
MNLLGEENNTIKKEINVDVNVEETKYMSMFHEQNSGQKSEDENM